MLTVKFGKLKWFSRDKNFGFLLSEGQEIFFHASGLRYIDLGEDDAPCFREPVELEADAVPKTDEEIVFVEARKARGPVAVNWGFAERWHRLGAKPVPAQTAALKIGDVWGAEIKIAATKAG